jgi:hypothetical protein
MARAGRPGASPRYSPGGAPCGALSPGRHARGHTAKSLSEQSGTARLRRRGRPRASLTTGWRDVLAGAPAHAPCAGGAALTPAVRWPGLGKNIPGGQSALPHPTRAVEGRRGKKSVVQPVGTWTHSREKGGDVPCGRTMTQQQEIDRERPRDAEANAQQEGEYANHDQVRRRGGRAIGGSRRGSA